MRSGSRSGKPAGSVVTSLTGAGATSANRGPKVIGQKDKTLGGPTMSRTVAAIHVVGAGAGGTPVFGVRKRAFNFPNDQIHFSHDLRGRLNTSRILVPPQPDAQRAKLVLAGVSALTGRANSTRRPCAQPGAADRGKGGGNGRLVGKPIFEQGETRQEIAKTGIPPWNGST